MSCEFTSLIYKVSPTLNIMYIPLPSKLVIGALLALLELPSEAVLVAAAADLLTPLTPTKLRARPPLLVPSNFAAADLTLLVAL